MMGYKAKMKGIILKYCPYLEHKCFFFYLDQTTVPQTATHQHDDSFGRRSRYIYISGSFLAYTVTLHFSFYHLFIRTQKFNGYIILWRYRHRSSVDRMVSER